MRIKILLISIVSALSVYAQSPVGIYVEKDNSNYLEIKSDGTFIYEYRTDTFIDLKSEGKWEMKGSKTIVLNSDLEPIQPEVEYEKIPTPGSKRDRHINVEVIADEYNEKDFFVVPVTSRVTVPNYEGGERGSHTMRTAFLVDNISFKIIKDPVDNPRPRPQQFFHKQAPPPKYEVLETESLPLMLNPGESANVTIFLFNEDFTYKTFKDKEVSLSKKGVMYKDDTNGKTYELLRKK